MHWSMFFLLAEDINMWKRSVAIKVFDNFIFYLFFLPLKHDIFKVTAFFSEVAAAAAGAAVAAVFW